MKATFKEAKKERRKKREGEEEDNGREEDTLRRKIKSGSPKERLKPETQGISFKIANDSLLLRPPSPDS